MLLPRPKMRRLNCFWNMLVCFPREKLPLNLNLESKTEMGRHLQQKTSWWICSLWREVDLLLDFHCLNFTFSSTKQKEVIPCKPKPGGEFVFLWHQQDGKPERSWSPHWAASSILFLDPLASCSLKQESMKSKFFLSDHLTSVFTQQKRSSGHRVEVKVDPPFSDSKFCLQKAMWERNC